MWRISPTVRFLLSVSVSMMSAAPPGPYPSYVISSYETPGSSPVPRWTARLMLSAGMLTDFASAMIVRSRGLLSGSPPPARAATVSSLMIRVNTLPRLASAAPFLCLIVCHLEWPDMAKTPDLAVKIEGRCYHANSQPPTPKRGGYRSRPATIQPRDQRPEASSVHPAGRFRRRAHSPVSGL